MIRDKDIKELIHEIVQLVDPEQIILFGSYATGNATEDSDVDLFIVKDSILPRHKRARQIRQAISSRFPFPKDLIFYTPAEIEEWSRVPQSFTARVVATGKIMYEKT